MLLHEVFISMPCGFRAEQSRQLQVVGMQPSAVDDEVANHPRGEEHTQAMKNLLLIFDLLLVGVRFVMCLTPSLSCRAGCNNLKSWPHLDWSVRWDLALYSTLS